MSRHNPDGSVSYGRKVESPVPAWLIRWLGVDCFHEVVSIDADSGSQQPLWDAISLDHSKITDAGLQHLISLPKLVSLNLSGTAVTDDGILKLCEARGLKNLSLERTAVTDQGLAKLAMLGRLEQLDLEGTNVTGEGVRWPDSLFHLDLRHSRLTDEGLKSFIFHLDLRHSRLTDEGLKSFIETRNLRIMVKGTAISKDAVEKIRRERPDLKFDDG